MHETFTLAGKEISVSGEFLKVARLQEQWYEDLEDPKGLVKALLENNVVADLLTFWQRVPHSEPLFDFPFEWEDVAVLRVQTYEHWWKNQIKSQMRNIIRRSEKRGLVVREAEFDDEFVNGMTGIFNETPVRQGRRFWHYGKDVETVKKEFSRYLFREDLIGAYYEDSLVGFVMLANAGSYAITGQIISKIEHRDKWPNNALIAKSVEICARKKIPYLAYSYWDKSSLTEFKRRNGFEKLSLPRYFIPLSNRGKIALKLRLHHGIRGVLPENVLEFLKTLRRTWYLRRYSTID